ncbi:hypothetical protein I553_1304 [Mycobacterium xenopi 4042]|uniref:Uncharacterized protein n=1 Tax=Mycobacterium xenopi 4042 TaxID=1299334 RepID=X8CFH7_MYCXE|nr:hypothetical protein I553_1304 [Mycobacterium xenopi 4042]
MSVSCRPYSRRISFFCSAVSATKYSPSIGPRGEFGAAAANCSYTPWRRKV